MHAIVGYHRPGSLEEALALLQRGNPRSVLLAGGTVVTTAELSEPVEMIDLQAVGLDAIRTEGTTVEIGAMVRLYRLATDPGVPALLRSLARREGPNTLRNAATVGGTLATADPDSELVAGFLVSQAEVELTRAGGATQAVALDVLLADGSLLEDSIISSVRIQTEGVGAVERTGRTPSDVSIVAAVGRAAGGTVHVALTGVASTPILVTPDQLQGLDPPGDFRGSGAYRRLLAETLTGRVLEQLGEHP